MSYETFFTRREQYHSLVINAHVSLLLEPATRARLASGQQYFMAHGIPDPAGAMHRAVIAVGNTIHAQATLMGYADCFGLIGAVLDAPSWRLPCSRRGLRQWRAHTDIERCCPYYVPPKQGKPRTSARVPSGTVLTTIPFHRPRNVGGQGTR